MKQVIYALGMVWLLTMAFAAAAQDKAPIVGGVVLGVKVDVQSVVATGYRASKLIRANVFNEKDEKIGNVKELIIANDGRVSLAIIPVGGFLGIGTKNVAIPTELFNVATNGKVTLPGGTKEKLKELPRFEFAE